MGRTYRHRKKKIGEQRPVPLGNDVGYLGLVNWLVDRKWSPSCKLVPVTFSDTGRGMMAKENIPAGTILASLPASALITARTVADSPLAEVFLNTSACFSTQQVLSSFLVLQKHLGEDSDWFAYVNILPLQYFSPVFATSDLIDAFPPTIVHKILRMQTKIDHLHSSLMGAVGQSRCPHCSKLYSELFTFDEFRWAWFTVNSRSVYLSPSVNKPCDIQLSDPNNIALAPFLDMINHSDLAKVNVLFDEANSTYSIVTLVPYKKHQEVFINYGSHSNEKLYLEYGFVLPSNCNDSVAFTFEEIVNAVRSVVVEINPLPKNRYCFLKSHGFFSDLYCGRDGLSWNARALIYVLVQPETLSIADIQKSIFSANFGLPNREVRILYWSHDLSKKQSRNYRKGQSEATIPPQQSKRSCFHPGATTLSRNGLNVQNSAPITSWDMVQLMFTYVWPKNDVKVKATVGLALGLLVSSKLLNVATPFFFKYVIDDLNNYLQILNTGTPAEMIVTSASALVLGYGIARVGAAGFGELRNAVFARVAQSSIRKVSLNVFAHLHEQDLAFHLSRRTGALSKAIDRGSRGINFALSAMVFNIVPTIFELTLVTAILTSRVGVPLGLISVSCVGLYALFTLSITQWRTKFRLQMNEAENDAGNKALDSLINYETVKYFNNERHELMRYDKALQKYQKASLKTTTSLALLNFGQNAIFSGALALAMYLVAKGVMQGTMTVGDMVMVNGLLFQLSIPLNFLGSVYREVRQAFIDMQTMFTLMKREPAIKNSASTVPLVIEESNSTIEFKNVYFQYTPGKPIFKDLSFTIPAGKKIAIVGGSGSGKSTITRLLYRFYEPDSGEILIGGTNIKDLDLNNLRKSIAIVPQDSVLFHDTLLYNLKYGNLEKSDEEAIEVAKLANLDWAVQSWPLKYETQVGERGLKLSGGEKQRVAIARAMLKGSPILIFDEATSSLDSITENQILDALDVATLNKTSVCIAHRLSTIMDADEILVLENGSLKERGSHCELLSDPSSMYYKMWNMQHHARKPEMNQ
ncbi:ATP-Hypothetical protein cassette subfamily B, member 7 [Nesidiocoris tenuis]|uniref:Iron-sulfur clusters transporter ABCB7, mitochondrial n=1 Tax=Nesidiocoris tenuis TaxID=355587 RepID=A0ABN7BAG4_9HEMI|nr:ATP-Hypothetical protein cassette subfamily B, member 7 [Nesidiocoris tenuis]